MGATRRRERKRVAEKGEPRRRLLLQQIIDFHLATKGKFANATEIRKLG